MIDGDLDAVLDKFDYQCLATIALNGWMVQGVFPDAESNTTTFTYTSGLTNFKNPELVATGLPPQVAQTLLNQLGELVRDGRKLVAGELVEGILDGYAVKLVEADPDNDDYPMSMATRFYECTALQMLWTDKQGAFPDSPEYSLPAASQPLLPLSR